MISYFCFYFIIKTKQKNSECLKIKANTYFDNIINLIECKKRDLLDFIQKEEETKKKVDNLFSFKNYVVLINISKGYTCLVL